jgi:pyruvate dehydrogenase E2 component (dihydrolipoamide acetyltransferase)
MLSKPFVIYWKNEEQGESRLPRIAMPIEIIVPRLGWSMEEGTFSEWLKDDGDFINVGDMLFVLEGEKATEEIETFDEGILHIPADAPQPGETVVVGQLLGYLLEKDEPAPLERQTIVAEAAPREVAPASLTSSGTRQDSQRRAPRHVVTPRARRAARELGIDCAGIQGTGRDGRIRERDVRQAVQITALGANDPHAGAEPQGTMIRISSIRRSIARRMHDSARNTAPVTLSTKLNATNLVNLRRQFKAADQPSIKASGTAAPDGSHAPGYAAIIVKLTAVALQQHPQLNAQWRDDGIFIPDAVHVAVAVDTDEGLLAPVLRDVAQAPLREVASRLRSLAARAAAGELTAKEMRGATFTVTNLGMYGVDAFTPIINPPQCAVLGVGRIVREPAVLGEVIAACDMMSLSLSFDHRIVDGAPAARFLDTLRDCIENPGPWLMS